MQKGQFKVMNVGKLIGSGMEFCKARKRIVLDLEDEWGSYMYDYTDDSYTQIYPHEGVFVVPVWVQQPVIHSVNQGGASPEGFPRRD